MGTRSAGWLTGRVAGEGGRAWRAAVRACVARVVARAAADAGQRIGRRRTGRKRGAADGISGRTWAADGAADEGGAGAGGGRRGAPAAHRRGAEGRWRRAAAAHPQVADGAPAPGAAAAGRRRHRHRRPSLPPGTRGVWALCEHNADLEPPFIETSARRVARWERPLMRGGAVIPSPGPGIQGGWGEALEGGTKPRPWDPRTVN